MRKNQSAEKIQNGAFKKQVYTLGLCFCWFLTLFCLFCGNPNNAVTIQGVLNNLPISDRKLRNI